MSLKLLKEHYRDHVGKASDRWTLYLDVYESLFRENREQSIALLEIGIQNGGSLEIWSQYFKNARRLVGCDIAAGCADLNFDDPRIAVVVGDANSDDVETKVLSSSDCYDIIIDDGSHTSTDIVRSFARYFPHLVNGGFYIVEDLHCSYWSEYGGGLYAPFSAISFFKRLVDVLNHEHWGLARPSGTVVAPFFSHHHVGFRQELLSCVHSVEFYNSLCVVRKQEASRNTLGSRVVSGGEDHIVPGNRVLHGTALVSSDQTASGDNHDPYVAYADSTRALRECREQVGALTNRLNECEERRDALGNRLNECEERRDALGKSYSAQEYELAAQMELNVTLQQQAAARHAQLIASTSWRITRPLRAVARLLRNDLRYGYELRRFLGRLTHRTRDPAASPPIAGVSAQQSAALFPDADTTKEPLRERTNSVDIIVCVHNALDDVRLCLESVLTHTLPPYRIILIDDGSQLETCQYLQGFAAAHGAKLIRNDTALGYTHAANAGLAASEAAWVLLLNSDTIVSQEWLERLVRAGCRESRIGVIGPLSNTASWQSVPRVQVNGDWAENPLPGGVSVSDMATIVASVAAASAIPIPFLNGFCLLIRQEALQDVGPFDAEVFGAGYGEENDFCIRARKRGWKLVVADDVFVYHSQSRSYSQERRLALAKRADDALARKYDLSTEILPQVMRCQDSVPLAAARARIASALAWKSKANRLARCFEGKRIAFVLPIDRAGGGANVVLQEARKLRQFGIDIWIVNLAFNRPVFEASYPDLPFPVLYAEDWGALAELLADRILSFDAVVATLFHSLFWLPSPSPDRVCGYYVQDFEPMFFDPADPEHEVARDSYAVRPDVVMITKTDWNARQVAAVGASTPFVIGPSVDTDLFRPSTDAQWESSEPIRICAMLRIDHGRPRRAPQLTIAILREAIERCPSDVDVTVFGSSDAELAAAGLSVAGFCNAGPLRSTQCAELFRGMDIFLDASEWQAMGLTALEAMASGCAALVPLQGGAVQYAIDRENAVVIDTRNFDVCVQAVVDLITDRDLLKRIRLRAVADAAQYSPEHAALAMADVLFGAEGGGESAR